MKNFLIFMLGAAVGVGASYKYFEKKFGDLAEEEIASVKEAFKQRSDDLDEAVAETQDKEAKKDIMAYAAELQKQGYTRYSNASKDDTEEVKEMDEPYVITPEQYGENEDYDRESLTYYNNGVLTDEFGDPIQDPAEMVGDDFASHFGEYEDDSVFIRNDKLRSDYEILRDESDYEE